MHPFIRTVLIAALVLLPASSLNAQSAVDPSGHWEGVMIAMTQTTNDVTIEAPSVGLSCRGVLSAAKTELVGTWTQGLSVLPLTLTRAKP